MSAENVDLMILLEQAEAQGAKSLKILQENGFVMDTANWLTLTHYSVTYGVSLQVLTNWLKRGIIPADSTLVLAEFNDLNLVKDQVYK